METKPCPFCGGEVNEIKPEDRGYLTICCGLVGSMISVSEWNTRPIEDTLQKRIAELKSNNRALEKNKHCLEMEIAELKAQNLQLCKFETFGTRFDGVVNDLLKAESEQDKEVE